jgi:hypothetical protein
MVHAARPYLKNTRLHSRKIGSHYKVLFSELRDPHALISPLFVLFMVRLRTL